MRAPLRLPVVGAVVSALFTLSHATQAQEVPPTDEPDEVAEADVGLPVAQAARPLVLPHLVLCPFVGVQVYRYDDPPSLMTLTHLQVGASLGLGDVVEVEVVPLWAAVTPGFGYAASVGVTARFVDDDVVETGGRVQALVAEEGAAVSLGLPVRLHGGDVVRVDTGVHVNVDGFSDDVGLLTLGAGDLSARPGLPVGLVVSLAEPFFVGVDSGLGILDLERAGDTVFIPAGVSVGGTIPVADRPLLDVSAGFALPHLVLPGREGDPISIEVWSLTFAARAYLDLDEMMAN